MSQLRIYSNKILQMQASKQLGLHQKMEIELSQIMSIVEVRDGLYGDDLCAILVKINSKAVASHNGANFLLQVWERARGKIYEKNLQYRPIGWEICSQYFYMKLDPRDDGDQYWFYEVFLGDQIRESKLKDYKENIDYKYFSCSGNWLYYASARHIYVIQANQQIAQFGMDLNKIKDSQIPHAYTAIHGNWVFHGFLAGKALVEDADHNLHFCDMNFDTSSRPYKITFGENMARIPQQLEENQILGADQIETLETYSRDNNTLYALTLKKSGGVDFYFNGVKLFSSTSLSGGNGRLSFEAIGITSDKIYLRTRAGETYKLKFDGKRRLVFRDAKRDLKLDAGNWNRILHERIKHERIELYFDFKLNGTELYVSYDRFCSGFDLLTKNEFRPETQIIKEEAQYMLGVSKAGDTVGLFQEAADPKQAKVSISKLLFMNSKKGLTSSQALPGRVVSKVEFQHFRISGWDPSTYKLQGANYFITEAADGGKQRNLLALWPCQDLAPVNIGAKVGFTGSETLVQIYTSAKHHSDQYAYFGLLDAKNKELKIVRHIDMNAFEVVQNLKMSKVQASEPIHTVVMPRYSNEKLIMFTTTKIFVYDLLTQTSEARYSSFNLQQYNIQIIGTKYLYFQSLDGICLLNLKALTLQQEGATEILLQKTYNSTNQIQYDPRFDRLLYFSDFETINIVPMPHKNIIVPFGFNRLSGKFRDDSIDACFVTQAPNDEIPGYSSDQMFKRLVAVTKQKKVIAWEYPTGQFIQFLDLQLPQVLAKEDNFYEFTSIHSREYGKRYMMYSSASNEEEQKNPSGSQINQRGQLYSFKLIKFEDSGKPFVFKQFKLHIMQGDYIHFDMEVTLAIHVQIDNSYCRQAQVYTLNKTPSDQILRPSLASVISRFPWELYSKCPESNFIFSPNLSNYISYDSKLQQFIVHRVDKGLKQRGPSRTILDGLFNQEDSDFDPMWIVNNFKWEFDHTFRFINKEGFEKMVRVNDGQWILKDSTFVPMKDLIHETPESLYYHHEYQGLPKSTLQRLLRKYQKTFTNRQLSIQNKRGTKDQQYILHRKSGKLFIMLNYGLYHLKLTQTLIKINQEQIARKIDVDDLKVLLMSVFHGNNYFLHKVFAKRYREDIGLDEDKLKNFSGVTLQHLLGKLYDKDSEKQRFFFPFMSNDRNETPFDLCLPTNIKSADVLLQYLKYQPAGSHSEYVILSLPNLIMHDLPSLPSYMDSRITQTRAHKKVTTMQDFSPIENKNYMLESSHLSPDYSDFFKKFIPKRFKTFCGKEIPVERSVILKEKEVKCEVLDLPFLHSYNGEGFSHAQGLFRELSNSDNLSIFTSKAVQYLIDYNWQQTKTYTIIFLFVPFIFFQATFIAYSNVYNGQFDNPESEFEVGYIVLSGLLYLFSLYFLMNEIGQLVMTKTNYFGTGFIWNAIDLLPPCFIIGLVTQRLRQDYEWDELMKPGFIDTIHAVTCILMWLKFLYFLRLFETTSHLVRVIFNMFWEMKKFIGILFIFYMAFGEAFLRLSEKTEVAEGEDPFLGNFAEAFVYAVRLGLGDSDVEGIYDLIQPVTGWILFVLFEVLTTILMMSLLVTLIMKQYDKISKDAGLSNYQQKAQLIYENSHLTQMCRCFACANFEMERNLIIITDKTDQGLVIKNNIDKDPMQVILEEVLSIKQENAMLKQTIQKIGEDNSKKIEAIYNEITKKKA